jgi:aspartate-semialdehyde dehydrogenase
MSDTHGPSIAVVGCTGAVGRELLTLLESRELAGGDLRLLASSRSAGRRLEVAGRSLTVQPLDEHAFDDVQIALFSAGSAISRRYASIAVGQGCTVIDNSSAFRMDDGVPLVVPEVNGGVLDRFEPPGIIANPNCSTIIALMAVTPLHRAAGVRRMVVATYQAASGAGAQVMDALEQQARDYAAGRPYSTEVLGRQYIFNVFSHDSNVGPDGYNEEETKLVRETHKIWSDPDVAITATCVRVPVLRAHCEAINLSFAGSLDESEARLLLQDAPGVTVVDDRDGNRFPEPIEASGLDDVLVGRIRGDRSQPSGKGLDLFVAGDQLRKGAALNAVQIAEMLGLGCHSHPGCATTRGPQDDG